MPRSSIATVVDKAIYCKQQKRPLVLVLGLKGHGSMCTSLVERYPGVHIARWMIALTSCCPFRFENSYNAQINTDITLLLLIVGLTDADANLPSIIVVGLCMLVSCVAYPQNMRRLRCRSANVLTIFSVLGCGCLFVILTAQLLGYLANIFCQGNDHGYPWVIVWVIRKGSGSCHLPTMRRRPIYNWEREDRRHEGIVRNRELFFNGVRSGMYTKNKVDPRSLFLHGMQATMSCADMQRYGGVADGGKVLCEAHRLLGASTDCLIYSFGVGNDCKFEMDLASQFPTCTFHLFDPSLGMGDFVSGSCISPQVQFHPWGVRGHPSKQHGLPPAPPKFSLLPDTSHPSQTKRGFHTLPRIMSSLGHSGRKLHLLKMDVEGDEFNALFDVISPLVEDRLNINLLQVELHNKMPPGYYERLITDLEARDLRLYFTERNPYYPDRLMEVAMINATSLKTVDLMEGA